MSANRAQPGAGPLHLGDQGHLRGAAYSALGVSSQQQHGDRDLGEAIGKIPAFINEPPGHLGCLLRQQRSPIHRAKRGDVSRAHSDS
jgi:hypothetical protein